MIVVLLCHLTVSTPFVHCSVVNKHKQVQYATARECGKIMKGMKSFSLFILIMKDDFFIEMLFD